jgi:hypothetical protein
MREPVGVPAGWADVPTEPAKRGAADYEIPSPNRGSGLRCPPPANELEDWPAIHSPQPNLDRELIFAGP